jgi:hypothetical protein
VERSGYLGYLSVRGSDRAYLVEGELAGEVGVLTDRKKVKFKDRRIKVRNLLIELGFLVRLATYNYRFPLTRDL